MNDKLLRAFIESQGFEIEEVVTTETEVVGGVTWGTKVIDYKVTKKVKLADNRSAEEKLNEAVSRMGQDPKERYCVICDKRSTMPQSDFCDDLGCSGRLKKGS